MGNIIKHLLDSHAISLWTLSTCTLSVHITSLIIPDMKKVTFLFHNIPQFKCIFFNVLWAERKLKRLLMNVDPKCSSISAVYCNMCNITAHTYSNNCKKQAGQICYRLFSFWLFYFDNNILPGLSCLTVTGTISLGEILYLSKQL